MSMLVIGSLGSEPFIARISLPVFLLGAVLFLLGTKVIRQAWVAIAYLFFMIPLPYLTLRALTYKSRVFDAGSTPTGAGFTAMVVR